MWPFSNNSFDNQIIQLLDVLKHEIIDKKDTLTFLTNEVFKMTQALDALNEQISTLIANVTAEGDAVKAAAMAIKGLTDQQAILTQQLQDAIAANDSVGVQAAVDALKAQNDAIVAQTAELAAAVPATPTV